MAPNGSASPLHKVNPKAFVLLFDRIYTGTAIAMPSGILCNAMVKAIGMPNVGFSKKLINVINPSGRLWMVKIRKVINPMCCKLD